MNATVIETITKYLLLTMFIIFKFEWSLQYYHPGSSFSFLGINVQKLIRAKPNDVIFEAFSFDKPCA